MSSSFGGNPSGGSAPGGDSSRKVFFCHQCNRTVAIVVAPSDDPICPDCNEGFLEEYENPNPTQSRISLSEPIIGDPLSSILPFLFPAFPAASSAGGHPNPTLSNSAGSDPSDSNYDPVAFLLNHINGLRSGGAQIQFVVENRPSDSAFRVPAFGDYFFGPGFEQLIQQLAENDPNRYGTPPASKSAIETLPTIKVTDEILNSEMNQCAVCQDDFEKDMEVKQMPCKHIYHSDCLLPWLELHNSCPVCRFELPTDDTDYEATRRGGPPPAASSETGEREGDNNRTVRRSFSITLPFPFGGGSSGDGGSNSNSDGSNSNSDGSNSNSGGQ